MKKRKRTFKGTIVQRKEKQLVENFKEKGQGIFTFALSVAVDALNSVFPLCGLKGR